MHLWTKAIIKNVLEVICLVMMSCSLEESQWFIMKTHKFFRYDLWSETNSILIKVLMGNKCSLKAKLDVHVLYNSVNRVNLYVQTNILHHVKGYISCWFYPFCSFLCLFSSVCNCMTNWMGQVAVARCSCYVNSWRGGYQDTQFYVRG